MCTKVMKAKAIWMIVMMTIKPSIGSDQLIEACKLGQYHTVAYYLDNFAYSPEIYSHNNKCLYEAFFTAQYDELVLLLCERVPNLSYFENSAQEWPKKAKLMSLIEQSKPRRLSRELMLSLKGALPEKSSKASQIKI